MTTSWGDYMPDCSKLRGYVVHNLPITSFHIWVIVVFWEPDLLLCGKMCLMLPEYDYGNWTIRYIPQYPSSCYVKPSWFWYTMTKLLIEMRRKGYIHRCVCFMNLVDSAPWFLVIIQVRTDSFYNVSYGGICSFSIYVGQIIFIPPEILGLWFTQESPT